LFDEALLIDVGFQPIVDPIEFLQANQAILSQDNWKTAVVGALVC
jgi:hypothetical protein